MASRFARGRRGDIKVKLRDEEREYLRGMCEELRALVEGGQRDDPAMRRLYPSASLDDEALATQMDDLIRDDLTRQRLESLDTMEGTLGASRVTEPDLEAWLAVCNDSRLVLGVRLSVSEESTPADFTGEEADAFSAYRFLTAIVSQLIEVLSGVTEMKIVWQVAKEQGRTRDDDRPPSTD